jgi:predicted flap endonuclease-1-like 5' DNA nuclease
MGLLSKLKSMLGLEETERAPGSGVDVTVEHEPDADSERAVKEAAEDGDETADGASSGGSDAGEEEPAAAGTDAAASTESLVDEDAGDDADRAAEPAEAAGTAAGGEEADDGDDDDDDASGGDAAAEPDDLTEIKGVGPAYADRLEDAGVTTFAGLAEADPEELAAATDLSPKRVGRWIDRAGDH